MSATGGLTDSMGRTNHSAIRLRSEGSNLDLRDQNPASYR